MRALALLLLIQASAETGIVAGKIPEPQGLKLVGSVTVVMLPPKFLEDWNTDAQRRLDMYWERYKPAFYQRKEMFLEISRQAYRDAILFTISRMRRDGAETYSRLVREVPVNGKFEFKNLPPGNYKLVAAGKTADQDVIWQEAIEVTNAIPQFIELKKQIP